MRVLLAIVVLVVVVGALGGIKALQIGAMIEAGEAGGPPPETVAISEVRTAAWGTLVPSVGSVTALRGVTVRVEVPGVVEAIRFTPGQQVEAGGTLVELESSVERANLEQARAALDLAQRNERRTRRLERDGTVAVSALDTAVSTLAGAVALVDSLEATLAKKTIRAPFAGTLGVKQISLGQYVEPGDELVSLYSLDPLLVDFALPQRELGRVAPGYEVQVVADTAPEPFSGTITAIEPQIDATTRNVKIQARVGNRDGLLRPGMYVGIQVVLPTTRPVMLVPTSAVLFAPYGDSVFLYDGDGAADTPATVTQQIIRTGETRGDFVEVLEGLEGGERVVSAGAFKLRNGQAVVLSERGTLAPSLDPAPAES